MRAFLVLVTALALAGCAEEVASPDVRHDELFLAGDNELWIVDADVPAVRHIRTPSLGPGDPPHRVIARGNHMLFWSYATLRHEGGDRFRLLVEDSHYFVPSARPNRVWLAIVREGETRGLSALREIDADGTVTVSDVVPPPRVGPHAAVDGGLLLPTDDGLDLWDPATQRTVRSLPRLGDLGPAHGDLLAMASHDASALSLLDTSSGDERPIGRPDGVVAWDVGAAEFSPDGRWLAVPARRDAAYEGPPRELVLVRVADGAARVVAGSEVPEGYVMAAWTAASDRVFFAGGPRFGRRTLLSYRPAEDRAHRLDVAVGDFYDAAAR